MNTPFRTITHDVDLAIVGGGLAGLCAAIAAARRGTKVAVMQDRPMFGGNASSEVRMWVCGANGPHRRETGIIEELELENIARNPRKVYSQWDQLMWDFVVREPNITAIMNCSCFDAEMSREPSTRSDQAPTSAELEARGEGAGMLRAGDPDPNTIVSVTGWQTTTQQFHTIRARQFADCSGDSILAPLTGAPYRIGREASDEFGESIQPDKSDRLVMGMSVLIQAREMDDPVAFEPPEWAHHYESVDDLPNRSLDPYKTNFWWVELGGTDDTIHNTEAIRAQLVSRAYGVWDLIKNRSDLEGVDRLELEYLGLFPGKRESRRYEGDYMVTQTDVESQGRFPDTIAFGGWSMDDHHPAALDHPGEPTIFHPAPSPWGIPLRSLYSRTVENLWFAGRNISVSHIALSSSRVMRTCAVIGQAVGTAAAVALREKLGPREATTRHISEIQRQLMDDDAWLPGLVRPVSPLTAASEVSASDGSGDPETLRNGIDRHLILSSETMKVVRPSEKEAAVSRGEIITIEDERMQENGWRARPGDSVAYEFSSSHAVSGVRLVFDSNLARYYREHRMLPGYFSSYEPVSVAPELVKSYSVEIKDATGKWHEAAVVTSNIQRLRRHHWKPREATAVRLTVHETWGKPDTLVFAFDVLGARDPREVVQ